MGPPNFGLFSLKKVFIPDSSISPICMSLLWLLTDLEPFSYVGPSDLNSFESALVLPIEPFSFLDSFRTAPEAISVYGRLAFPDKNPEWNPPVI